MNTEEFNTYWENEYPKTFPINYELKSKYIDRWFRVHSLPESKRYADSDDEYKIILQRQNQLFNDLIGEETEIILSFGVYTEDIINEDYKELIDFGEFNKVRTINTKEIESKQYEDTDILNIYIKKDIWRSNSKNKILKAIADDEIRIMFICPIKNCIIAPYDGGVDIIMDTTKKRDELKIKYKKWLSEREDGM